MLDARFGSAIGEAIGALPDTERDKVLAALEAREPCMRVERADGLVTFTIADVPVLRVSEALFIPSRAMPQLN